MSFLCTHLDVFLFKSSSLLMENICLLKARINAKTVVIHITRRGLQV